MLHGKAADVANDILAAFERGTVPAACAQIFLHRKGDRPSARWSWRNQLIAALRGHADARGFRQWQEVGRTVRKGEHAFHILGPVMVKAKRGEASEDDSSETPGLRLAGFRTIPVFGFDQTEGEPLPGESEHRAFLDSLPLIEVARAWNLQVTTFNGRDARELGYYGPATGTIALGVENLSTWAHELIHVADHRRGDCGARRGGATNEVVAEFGGAILLECLGHHGESDRGGVYAYIESYCRRNDRDPLSVCTELLDRACAAVDLLLETADGISRTEAA